jgi:hypothetical protein
MGYFSSSYEYYAYSGTSSLFDEDEVPDTFKNYMLQAGIDDDISSSEVIPLVTATDQYARIRAQMRYASREYVHGLPTSNQLNVIFTNQSVIDAIEREVGQPITLRTLGAGVMNESFFIAKSLNDLYMDPAYFPWPSGDPADTNYEEFADTVEIPVVNPDTGTYYEAPNTPSFYRHSFESRNYSVSFNYVDNLGQDQVWQVANDINLEEYKDKSLVQARYRFDSSLSVTEYWVYEIGSDEDPIFESEISYGNRDAEYLPVAILMHDKVWYDEAGDIPLQETTDRLLKKIAVKASELKEGFIEQQEADAIENGEPTAEVWDFHVHHAVPIFSQIRGSREYMYEFFKWLEPDSRVGFQDYQNYISGTGGNEIPFASVRIEEGDLDGFHSEVGWCYIQSVDVPGQYMVNDTVPLEPRRMHSKVIEYSSETLASGEYQKYLDEVHGADTRVAAYTGKKDVEENHYVRFTQQHMDSNTGEYWHTHVLVMGPTMRYKINTKIADGSSEYRFRYADCPLFPEVPEGEIEAPDSEFRIPINLGVLKDVSRMQREELLADALCATVYLVEERKIKWYQKSFWRWAIPLIAVVVVVLTWQYQLLPAIAGLAAAATTTISALAFYALYAVVTFAIGFLIAFSGALIGGIWGQIFILVASLYLVGGPQMFSGLSSTWNILMTQPSWGAAINFVNTVKPFMNLGTYIYQTNELDKLKEDYEDLALDAKEKQQKLRDAYDTLHVPSNLDVNYLMEAQKELIIEQPDEFYARSLNPDPGMLGFVLIDRFYEIALMLDEDGNNDMVEYMFNDFANQRGVV